MLRDVVGRTKDERYNADEFLSSTKWSDKDDDLDLGLKEEVVTAAESAGLEWLSLVQERAIPTLTCKEPMMVSHSASQSACPVSLP